MNPRRPSRSTPWLGALTTILLAVPSLAQAAVIVTASLPAPASPFSNAVTAWGTASTLTVTVTNATGSQSVHQVDILFPNANYTSPGGTAAGWTVSTFQDTGTGYWGVRYSTACGSTGLAAGTSANFVVSLVPPLGSTTTDTTTSPFQVTASTTGTGSGCGTTTTGATTFTAPVKALYVTGAAAPTQGLGPSMTGVVTWIVTNKSSVAQSGVTVVPVVSPSTGESGSCTTIASLASQANGTVTCTYTLSASGTFTFTANARNASGTTTAVGASAGTITVGTSSVAWSKTVMVLGRPATYTLGFTVKNSSGLTVSRVDLTNPSSTGFTISAASATNGLAYVKRTSTAADLIFTGTLAAGASSVVSVTFSAVPAVTSTTTYAFGVKLTPGSGGGAYPMTTSQQVALVVPISDVAGLTIRSNATGQTLAWTNTSAHGSTHDGVVVFRAAAGAVPAVPADFAVYTAGTGGVVFADGVGSSISTFTDGSVGSYDYRVCNRDAYYVYSACNTGFWNNAGWLDSEAYPSGGWVHAVAGSTLLRPGYLTGGRLCLANNGPSVTVVDMATGARAFPPVAVPSLPTAYTPVFILSSGERMIYAADQSGVISAIDYDTGTVVWQVTKTGASFTAGVSGITRWSAAAAFASAYSMDILLIGSTTGTIYAINTLTGATLWTLSAGAGIYSLITYDPLTNNFFVGTAGAGVKAYTLTGSSPTVVATPVSGWTNPQPSGNFRVLCVRTAGSTGIACINSSGMLYVMDKTTGALQAPAFTTSISAPTGLVRVSGSASKTGLVVASATQVQVLSATGTPYAIASLGAWSPGITLSTPSIYADNGYLVAGGSDRRIHRVALANAIQQAQSQAVGVQGSTPLLGQPAFDSASGLYIFGTSDGHIWALPSF